MSSLYLSHREHGLSLTQDARAPSELCALVCVKEEECVDMNRQIQSAGIYTYRQTHIFTKPKP